MASPSKKGVRILSKKIRKYWQIRDILPVTDTNKLLTNFTLHNEEWGFFFTLDHSLSIFVFNYASDDVADKFNVRVGICGKCRENVVLSNAKPLHFMEFVVMNLISSSQLDSILQSEDVYLFFVEIVKKDTEKETKAKSCKRKFEIDYEELLLSGKKSDFTINVKHRKFTCHSLILGARSPVFSAMLEHEMKEKSSCEVFIADADPSIFQDFLLYLYTGKEEYVNSDNITSMYKLGDKYFMDDLKRLCIEHMKMNMSTENFFEFFLISQQYNNSELSDSAIKFFLENSEDIVEHEKWPDFMKECNDETHVLIKALAKQNKKMKLGIVC